MNDQIIDILPLSEATKMNIIVAFLKRQAAIAEMKTSTIKVEQLISKLDKDGELAKLLKEGATAHQKALESEHKLNDVVTKAGMEVGKTDLVGYSLNFETGDIIRVSPMTIDSP